MKLHVANWKKIFPILAGLSLTLFNALFEIIKYVNIQGTEFVFS